MNSLAPPANSQLDQDQDLENFESVDVAPAALAGELALRGINSLATSSDPQLNQQEAVTNFEGVDDAPAELEGELSTRGTNSLSTGADPQLNEQSPVTNYQAVDDAPLELSAEITSRGMNALATGADPQLNEQESPTNFSTPSEEPVDPGSIHGKQDAFTATQHQTIFSLSHSPIGGTESVCINGLRQSESEYSADDDILTFTDGTGILSGDLITISYLY